MSTFLQIVAAGLAATAVMSVFLWLLRATHTVDSELVPALGGLVVKDERHSKSVGFLLTFVFGVIFAFVYLGLWSLFDFTRTIEFMLLGVALGFAHGLVFSIMLVNLVSEHHPRRKFRQEVGVGVALSYLLAHVVYGVALGAAAGALNNRFETMQSIARTMKPLGFG